VFLEKLSAGSAKQTSGNYLEVKNRKLFSKLINVLNDENAIHTEKFGQHLLDHLQGNILQVTLAIRICICAIYYLT
jgi:hypothetical protein